MVRWIVVNSPLDGSGGSNDVSTRFRGVQARCGGNASPPRGASPGVDERGKSKRGGSRAGWHRSAARRESIISGRGAVPARGGPGNGMGGAGDDRPEGRTFPAGSKLRAGGVHCRRDQDGSGLEASSWNPAAKRFCTSWGSRPRASQRGFDRFLASSQPDCQ